MEKGHSIRKELSWRRKKTAPSYGRTGLLSTQLEATLLYRIVDLTCRAYATYWHMPDMNTYKEVKFTMNAVMENIVTRRSVRAFKKDPVPADCLDEILKAALYAPSGMNRQTWQFTAVTDREKIQALAEAVGRELSRENYHMYDPAAIVITSNERDSHLGQDDNACAMENMFLAAHALGIGSVWINQVRDVCDLPSVRTLLKEWGVPDSHVVYGVAALGYAAPEPAKEVVKHGKVVIV